MTLRAAVVGVGYLGSAHARHYAMIPGAELVAVVDVDAARAREIASRTGAEALTDHRALAGRIDVASVAVPTRQHFPVTRDLLRMGAHVLLEKPLAATVAEARELTRLAGAHGRVLQIGHVERFNPAVRALTERVDHPLFIECHRLAPFVARGTDVSVILDLMIHDIDLVLALVAAPIQRIDANGAAVLSADIDIANARLRFTDGCVANITASRISLKRERKMRVFQHDAYLAADLQNLTLDIRFKVRNGPPPRIEGDSIAFEKEDLLQAEIRAFLDSVRHDTPPLVGGAEGLRALEAAFAIARRLPSRLPTRPATRS